MGRKKSNDDAELWRRYRDDSTCANRNAIFEFHWNWIERRIRWILNRTHQSGLIPEASSFVATRVLKVYIPGFDTSAGASFRGYLNRPIWFSVLSYLATRNRRPKRIRDAVVALEQARNRVASKIGHRPTDHEIEVHAGLSERWIATETAGEQTTNHDMDAMVSRKVDWTNEVNEALETLGPYESWLAQRYYLDGYTAKEISEQLQTVQSNQSIDMNRLKNPKKQNKSTTSGG